MTLRLESAVMADIPFAVATQQAEHARPFVTAWSPAEYARAITEQDQEYLLIFDEGERVGFILLAGLSRSPHDIELRRIVVTKPGIGVGCQALGLVLGWVFADPKAHRLWLDVWSSNVRGRRLYTTLGFREDRMLGEVVLVDGRRDSLIIMAILRPEWECLLRDAAIARPGTGAADPGLTRREGRS